MARSMLLGSIGPGAGFVYYVLANIYPGRLLYSPWFYAVVAFGTMLFMTLPLWLVRASGFRMVRQELPDATQEL